MLQESGCEPQPILSWKELCFGVHLPLSGPLLMVQVGKYATMMNTDSFKASESWFTRFRDRHELVFRSLCGKKSSVAENMTIERRNVRLLQHIACISPK